MKSKKSRMLLIVAMMLISSVGAMDMRDAEEPKDAQSPEEEAQSGLNDLRKQEALEKFKEILGIKGSSKEESRKETPPQFMVELYDTVTDSDGKTSGVNPYNAKIVRSYVDQDSSSSHFYIFNISSLEQNESVLEAELHLYRKRSSPKSMHPSVLSSPYYLIRVYQVLPDKSLEEPDLHRLLNVHYVGAYDSGWQVFNVKQAVLSWLAGSPNLGLLVTASTIFGDQVTVDFSRRDDEPHNKQPILVLFNDERTTPSVNEEADVPRDEDNETAERPRNKRHGGQPEVVPDYEDGNRQAHFRRVKKPAGRHERQKDSNEIGRHRRVHGTEYVPRRKSLEQTLTSMDIYQRAILRERLNAQKKNSAVGLGEPSLPTPRFGRRRRDAPAAAVPAGKSECRKEESEPCAKRELYVNFRDIGLATIIAPEGYAAYQCRGHCRSPLSQDQKPTNHATIQGIINKMNIAPNQDVDTPCCVPVSLSSISILYHDDDRDGVVLKSYTDMAVVSCGCR